MTRVRAIDADGDWLFGKGQNDYLTGNAAVAQSLKTRLLSFLGDCFFDQGAGIDWFNLCSSKDLLPLNLAVQAVILNTPYVTGIIQTSIVLDVDRMVTITFNVQTAYSTAYGEFQYDLNGIG